MALSNYTELQAAVADQLDRTDLTGQIPDFIKLAEAQMNRVIRHWRMQDRVTASVDTQYTALPSNFAEAIRMVVTTGNYSVLELVGNMELSRLRANVADAAGRPQFYAINDQAIEVFPTPDAVYTTELVYYETIDPLANTGTNWLLTYYPDAYLYGACLHSAPYLQEDARMQTWGALYEAAISAINQDAERAQTGGSGRRIKIRSY